MVSVSTGQGLEAEAPSAEARPAGDDRRVIVVGGGLAGIAAALRLAEVGVAVELFETRRKLGGRATSFEDSRTGWVLDNCQHVAMGCCANFLDLCRRLEMFDRIRWSRRINWIERGGRVSAFRPGLAPAPMHFAESFAAARFLTMREKTAIARAATRLMRDDRFAHQSITFGEYLRCLSQPSGAIEKFWRPIVVSACNLEVDRVAASVAMHVFQDGFLARRDAAAIGVPAVPLVDLYEPAERAIREGGGVVRLRTAVARVGSQSVETNDGEIHHADAVILAVPFERAAKLVEPEPAAGDERFERLARLEHSPILGVHLFFDRSVMRPPHAVLVGGATQWLFRKDEQGKAIHAVISAADDWMSMDESQIVDRVLADVRAYVPGAAGATLENERAVKERRATFAATPQAEANRPATTGESGVILAGDYVRTGWPATMEGAVRSGYLAAAAAIGRSVEWALAREPRPAALYRLASRAGRRRVATPGMSAELGRCTF